MPETYINATEHGTTDTRTILAKLAELLPSGTGYVRILADGTITLQTPSGSGGSGQTFFEEAFTVATDNVIPPLSFTPKYATSDVWLTIGSGWVTHSVKEGGFTVNTASRTIAIVAGAQYVVKSGWTVTVRYATDDDVSPPTITALSPSSVTVGETLTITGTGFTPTAVVMLGGQAVTVTFVSATTLTIVLPALAYSGNTATVQTATGLASSSSFNFTAPLPTLTSFAPTSRQSGQTVVITGTNFTGATQVLFGGVAAASFVVDSPTQITATVGAGATGAVQVQTLYGSASLAGFTHVISTPMVLGFTPTLATAGTQVVVTGTNFTGSTAVRVNGASVHSFTVDSPTQITAVVSKTQATGTVQVENAFGTGASAATLTIDQLLPFPRAGRVMSSDSTTIAGRLYETSSDPAPANPAWSAFNAVVGSGSWWLSSTVSVTRLTVRLPFACRVSSYRIQHLGYLNNHFPRDWEFQGSNDGVSWTTLDTRTGVAAVADATYTMPLSADFQYFSIKVNAPTTVGWTPAISELTLDITL